MMCNASWYHLLTEVPNPGAVLRAAQVHWPSPLIWDELADLVAVPQDATHHPEGDAFAHTTYVLDAMARVMDREGITGDRRVTFMLAALTHDFGKATTTVWNKEKGKWTAYGHDVAGVPLAKSWLEKVGTFPQKIAEILPLVRWHMSHCRKEFSQKAVRKLARELQPMTIADLLFVLEADCAGRAPIPPGLPPAVTDQLIPIARACGWLDGPHPADRPRQAA